METENYRPWKESIEENDYRNIDALAEITHDIAARLEVFIDGYNDGYVSAGEVEELLELGKRALEAEESFHPNHEGTGYDSLEQELGDEEEKSVDDYIDMDDIPEIQSPDNVDQFDGEDVEKFLIQNSPESERKLAAAQQKYQEQLERAYRQVESVDPRFQETLEDFKNSSHL